MPMLLAFAPFAAVTGPPPLREEPLEWGGPLDATGLMSMVAGLVGAAYRGGSETGNVGATKQGVWQFVVWKSRARRL